MKKTYLVKKNPELPASDDNWTIMNGYEFAMFMKTEEGKARKNNFGYFCPLDADDRAIIAECGRHFANTLHKERNIYKRQKKHVEESGIEILSLDYEFRLVPGGNLVSLEELVPDERVDVEGDAILRDEKERLAYAVAQLDGTEADLVYRMYLADKTLTVREYAEMLGVSKTTAGRMHREVLAKLKHFMNMPKKVWDKQAGNVPIG